MIAPLLMKRLIRVVVLAAVVASFGWIMVKSGLQDRPWVNAYKLMFHLGLGTLLFIYLGYVSFSYSHKSPVRLSRSWFVFGAFVFIQLLIGGLMSGMKAGLFYPTWPEIDHSWIPSVILDGGNWKWENMKNYDTNGFAPGLVQFVHRMMAYALYIWGMVWGIKNISGRYNIVPSAIFLLALNVQVLLGILTLINCVGHIPVALGVMHQAGGVLLLLSIVYIMVKEKRFTT